MIKHVACFLVLFAPVVFLATRVASTSTDCTTTIEKYSFTNYNLLGPAKVELDFSPFMAELKTVFKRQLKALNATNIGAVQGQFETIEEKLTSIEAIVKDIRSKQDIMLDMIVTARDAFPFKTLFDGALCDIVWSVAAFLVAVVCVFSKSGFCRQVISIYHLVKCWMIWHCVDWAVKGATETTNHYVTSYSFMVPSVASPVFACADFVYRYRLVVHGYYAATILACELTQLSRQQIQSCEKWIDKCASRCSPFRCCRSDKNEQLQPVLITTESEIAYETAPAQDSPQRVTRRPFAPYQP